MILRVIKFIIILGFLYGCADCKKNRTCMDHQINIITGDPVHIDQMNSTNPEIGKFKIKESKDTFYYFKGNFDISKINGEINHNFIAAAMKQPESKILNPALLNYKYAFFHSIESDLLNKEKKWSFIGRGAYNCIPNPAIITTDKSSRKYSIISIKYGKEHFIPLVFTDHIEKINKFEFFKTESTTKLELINQFINDYKGDIEIGLEKEPIYSSFGVGFQQEMILYHKKKACKKFYSD